MEKLRNAFLHPEAEFGPIPFWFWNDDLDHAEIKRQIHAFLEKGMVAVVPTSSFGAPNFIRWTYAASMENIKEGMDRLEAFLKG